MKEAKRPPRSWEILKNLKKKKKRTTGEREDRMNPESLAELKNKQDMPPLLPFCTLKSSCFPLCWESSGDLKSPLRAVSTWVGSHRKGRSPRTADVHLFFLVMGAQGACQNVPGTQHPDPK